GNGERSAINTSAANPYLVEIVGPSTSPESFAIYDLSNPQSPTLLDVATTSFPHMVDLSFAGNSAFATTSYITYFIGSNGVASQTGDFLAFDFTNPSNPQFLGSLQPSSLPGSGNQNLKPFAEVVDQTYAYVASSTATGTSTSGTGVLDVI